MGDCSKYSISSRRKTKDEKWEKEGTGFRTDEGVWGRESEKHMSCGQGQGDRKNPSPDPHPLLRQKCLGSGGEDI